MRFVAAMSGCTLTSLAALRNCSPRCHEWIGVGEDMRMYKIIQGGRSNVREAADGEPAGAGAMAQSPLHQRINKKQGTFLAVLFNWTHDVDKEEERTSAILLRIAA